MDKWQYDHVPSAWAALRRLRKNSIANVFLGRARVTRANKSFNFVIPTRLQPPEESAFRVFPQQGLQCMSYFH